MLYAAVTDRTPEWTILRVFEKNILVKSGSSVVGNEMHELLWVAMTIPTSNSMTSSEVRWTWFCDL